MKKRKRILLALFICATFFNGCSNDDTETETLFKESVVPVEYSFDTDVNSTLLFKDGDLVEKMTSESLRYEIGKVLRVKAVNETTIEITNFAPVDINDATVLMTIKDQAKPIKLFNIKKIRAHGTQQIKYPFVEGTKTFIDVDNNEIDLSQYEAGIPMANVSSFDFTGETDLIKKLKLAAKLKWKIKYHDYDPDNDPNNDWKDDITAKDIRRWSALIINLAYLIQSEEAKNEFINEPIIDNDGITLFSTEEKQAIFQKYLNFGNINCGVVVNFSGLGGRPSTFGLDENILKGSLNRYYHTPIHELGHMMGYYHSSNMTYQSATTPRTGAVIAFQRVYDKMMDNSEFPIKKADYYMPTDLQ